MICKPFDSRNALPSDFSGEVHVRGKTLKGKNRVRCGGVYYHIAGFREKVAFSEERDWFCLQSKLNQTVFWIRQINDPNIDITHISE